MVRTHRVDVDPQEQPPQVRLEPTTVRPSIPEVELESPVLPRDHPPWMRDAVALSTHAKRLLERVRPLVIRALGFWDHAVLSIHIAGRRVNIDPAGCYRID